ncbi:MAG: DNA repair protein RecO, partial [Luteimonas sp.]|nr:DNA repair protein RecO [Luteimonas sp.]
MRYAGESAYVLHARAWRETSLLVEVLSERHGRVGLVARGVQGPKRHALRAALQPLQHIRFDAVQRGELAQLSNAEALDAAPQLAGEAMLAGFYVNELLMRLAPRQDPHSALYALYGEVRGRLAAGGSLAWTLRRFERDL